MHKIKSEQGLIYHNRATQRGSTGAYGNKEQPIMLVTTTPTIEGKPIKQYLGLVTGEAILGANIFKDLFAGIRDIVGGRAGAYEQELRRAQAIALSEMQQVAAGLGANAIVGVDLDYETVGQGGSMLMVSVSGTAVVID